MILSKEIGNHIHAQEKVKFRKHLLCLKIFILMVNCLSLMTSYF